MLPSVRSQYTDGGRHGGTQHAVDLIVDRPDTSNFGIWAMIAADEEADRKLDGGYNTQDSNLCPDCFIYRSVNGTCGC